MRIALSIVAAVAALTGCTAQQAAADCSACEAELRDARAELASAEERIDALRAQRDSAREELAAAPVVTPEGVLRYKGGELSWETARLAGNAWAQFAFHLGTLDDPEDRERRVEASQALQKLFWEFDNTLMP